MFVLKNFRSKQLLVWFMNTHYGIEKYAIWTIENMSLKLYSTCISVLQNFGFFFRPPPKLPKFAKFYRNLGEILNPMMEHTTPRAKRALYKTQLPRKSWTYSKLLVIVGEQLRRGNWWYLDFPPTLFNSKFVLLLQN